VRQINFQIDETEWDLFKSKTPTRNASNTLRDFIRAFNNNFEGDPYNLDREAEIKLRNEFNLAEKAYLDLKIKIDILEAKQKTDELEKNRKAREIAKIIADAEYNTAREMLHLKGMKGEI
jgi:hypothetical protein